MPSEYSILNCADDAAWPAKLIVFNPSSDIEEIPASRNTFVQERPGKSRRTLGIRSYDFKMMILTEIRKAILKKGLISTVSSTVPRDSKKEEPQKRLSR